MTIIKTLWRRPSDRRAGLLIVLLAAWMSCDLPAALLPLWNHHSRPSWVGCLPGQSGCREGRICDLDTRLIHDGLLTAPHFRDTLRWWTGAWVGQVPFYRPITSLVFWSEWKALGEVEVRWTFCGWLLHLGAVGLLTQLAVTLYRRFRLPWPRLAALLCGSAFVTGLWTIPVQEDIAAQTYGNWKNQPDSLCLLLFCACVQMYLRRLNHEALVSEVRAASQNNSLKNDSEADDDRAKYAPRLRFGQDWWLRQAPLILYLSTCAVKEAGILLPLLLPALEWPQWKIGGQARRLALRRLLPLLLALPLFLVFRGLCLHDAVGFRYGSNAAWSYQLFSSMGGIVMGLVITRTWLPLVQGVGIAGLLLWLTRRQVIASTRPLSRHQVFALLLLTPLLLIGAAVPFLPAEGDLLTRGATALLVIGGTYRYQSLSVLLLLVAGASLLFYRKYLFLFTYSWTLCALIPAVFSPAMLHRFYLMNAGYALLLGAGLTLWAAHFAKPSWTKETTKPSYAPSSAPPTLHLEGNLAAAEDAQVAHRPVPPV